MQTNNVSFGNTYLLKTKNDNPEQAVALYEFLSKETKEQKEPTVLGSLSSQSGTFPDVYLMTSDVNAFNILTKAINQGIFKMTKDQLVRQFVENSSTKVINYLA